MCSLTATADMLKTMKQMTQTERSMFVSQVESIPISNPSKHEFGRWVLITDKPFKRDGFSCKHYTLIRSGGTFNNGTMCLVAKHEWIFEDK